jgi:hypothetical protein
MDWIAPMFLRAESGRLSVEATSAPGWASKRQEMSSRNGEAGENSDWGFAKEAM